MNIEQHSYNQLYDLCKQHMHSYVLAETNDGSQFDGILTGLDEEYVYFAVPIDSNDSLPLARALEPTEDRQLGYPGYGYPSGFGYPGYGFYGPGRRFQRLVLPLAALTAISLLPWY